MKVLVLTFLCCASLVACAYAGQGPKKSKHQSAILRSTKGQKTAADKTAGSEAQDQKAVRVVTDSWTLTYVANDVPDPEPPATPDTSTKRDSAGEVVTLLNSIFGRPDAASGTFAAKEGGKILLTGDPKDVASARQLLATVIDVPYPQVRVKVWAIQLNELKNHAANQLHRMQVIQEGIMEGRLIASALTQKLGDWVGMQPLASEVAPYASDLEAFPFAHKEVGKDEPGKPFYSWSRGFSPLRLALLPSCSLDELRGQASVRKNDRKDPVDQVLTSLAERDKDLPVEDQKQLSRLRDYFRIAMGSEPESTDVKRERNGVVRKGANGLFVNYATALGQHPHPDANAHFLAQIVRYWNQLGSQKPLNGSISLEGLTQYEFNVDKWIHSLSKAWADDMSDMIYTPLTTWANEVAGIRPNTSNPALDSSSTSGIAVTSGQAATLIGKTTESRQYTTPSTLTGSQIKSLLGLPGVPSAGAALLENITTQPPVTSYEALAPGVSVGLIPTVLPDMSEARIHIILKSAVAGNDPKTKVALDAVTMLTATTDVRVSTYDVFELATLDSQNTALGDVRWDIPVLDEIPLIGPMFRGPRRVDTKVHKALILVSVGILPCSINMLRAYKPLPVTVYNRAPKPP